MARSDRLLELLQLLRRQRRTVSGETLARDLGVSLRTVRRDMATLQAMGADIVGEAGVGYIMRPGFLLPPLALTEDEVQALRLGAHWVRRQDDSGLALSVDNALAKIEAVLPSRLRTMADDDSIYVGGAADGLVDLAELRMAMREQRKVAVTLQPADAGIDEQRIWPIMLGFVDGGRHIAAWWEQAACFRVVSVLAIAGAQVLADRYPGSRRRLIRDWRSQQILPCNRTGSIC